MWTGKRWQDCAATAIENGIVRLHTAERMAGALPPRTTRYAGAMDASGPQLSQAVPFARLPAESTHTASR
ncbi:hypothetical protein CT3_21230 [Comamonas terrigena NBRC 13299]|nr:hypothetical protein CT3_21230 [Comamonas terrigena NBRC 13299]